VAGLVAGAAVAGPGLNVFGLDHNPLGNAQLSSDGGRLTVSNIGSSGKDGVSIDLGESQGLVALPVFFALYRKRADCDRRHPVATT